MGLTQCQDHQLTRQVKAGFRAGVCDGPGPATFIRWTQLHTLAGKHGTFGRILKPHRGYQFVQDDAFFECLLDLLVDRRHFTACAAVNDAYLAGTDTQGRTGGIHRGIAAADYDNALAIKTFRTLAHFFKEMQTLDRCG